LIGNSRKRAAPGVLAVALALGAVLGSGVPVAAYTVLSETGLLGSYTFTESMAAPRARCGYSSRIGDYQYLRFMRLGPPTVLAADRNSDKRDTRIAGWRFLIQRLGTDLTTWTTVAQSPIQKARAYEDAAAPFTAMRVNYSASRPFRDFRAVVVINWYRPNGTVEGRARLAAQYYQLRDPSGVGPTMQNVCVSAIQFV
jgi:hypothetical protein